MKVLVLIFLLWPGTLVAQSCAKEEDALKQCKLKGKYESELKKIQDKYSKRMGDLARDRVNEITKLKRKYGIKE